MGEPTGGVTRREVIVGGVAGVVAVGSACSAPTDQAGRAQASLGTRMPVVFLPHGGGPWPWVEGMFAADENAAMARYLDTLKSLPRVAPRALLVISAHWEERVPTVMTGAAPPLLFDYNGFPDHTYKLTWPAPGAPQLATRIRELLDRAGIPSASDDQRGFDHGVFVPLKLAYPEASIPTLQLSLTTGLDPVHHLAIGRALAPLRDEGVFVLGSGMSFHNMSAFFDRGASFAGESQAFDTWLTKVTTAVPAERERALSAWASAPSARACHPREEHLLPLMVCAGAAGDDQGASAFSGTVGGMRVSAFQFG